MPCRISLLVRRVLTYPISLWARSPSCSGPNKAKGMQPRYIEFIHDVLITLHQNIRELKERRGFADPEELSHIEGKLLAYQEVLAILQSSADEFHIPREESGL